MKITRRIAVLVLLAALALLVAAAVVTTRHQRLVSDGEPVTGYVTSLSEHRDSDGAMTYSPVYRYEYQGVTYRHTSRVSTSSPTAVGTTKTLYVDRTDPSHAMADTFSERWFGVAMLAAFGLVGLIVSIVMFRVAGALTRSARRRDVLQPAAWSAEATSASAASAGNAGPFVKGKETPDPRGPFV